MADPGSFDMQQAYLEYLNMAKKTFSDSVSQEPQQQAQFYAQQPTQPPSFPPFGQYSQGNYGGQQSFDQQDDESEGRGGGGGGYRGGRGRGRGGRGGGRDFNRSSEPPPPDTVYVSGLGSDINERDLSERFGSIGRIRIDKKTRAEKIHIYKDTSGVPKGDATITYEDPETVNAAINWFSGKELKGKIIKVEIAQRKEPPPGSDRGFRGGYRGGRGGHRDFGDRDRGDRDRGDRGDRDRGDRDRGDRDYRGDRGDRDRDDRGDRDRGDRGGDRGDRGGDNRRGGFGGGGRGGGFQKSEGDWSCPGCGNVNFARRTSCNRCHASKPENSGSGGGGGNNFQDKRRAEAYNPATADESYAINLTGGPSGSNYPPPQQGMKQGKPPVPNTRDGDWKCDSCGNINWAKRSNCNKCNAPKPASSGSSYGGSGSSSGYGGSSSGNYGGSSNYGSNSSGYGGSSSSGYGGGSSSSGYGSGSSQMPFNFPPPPSSATFPPPAQGNFGNNPNPYPPQNRYPPSSGGSSGGSSSGGDSRRYDPSKSNLEDKRYERRDRPY